MAATETSTDEKAKTIIKSLICKGIRIMAFDFDNTIVDVHTGGDWRDTIDNLQKHIRPTMKKLFAAALESPIHVCIVTFSEQAKLIQDLLTIAFAKYNYKKILLRCNTRDWPRGEGENCYGPLPQIAVMTLGKEQHLSWIVTKIYQTHGDMIKPQEILLLDDDERNCRIAKEFHHQSFLVPENFNLNELSEYVQNLKIDLNSSSVVLS